MAEHDSAPSGPAGPARHRAPPPPGLPAQLADRFTVTAALSAAPGVHRYEVFDHDGAPLVLELAARATLFDDPLSAFHGAAAVCFGPTTPPTPIAAAARALFRFHHPAIPRPREVGTVGLRPWIVTGRPSGALLGALLDPIADTHPRWAPADALALAEALLEALAHAHARGVTHRALSPDTLYWGPGGLGLVGWTSAAVDGAPPPDSPVGAPRRAPESWLGAAPTPATDLYAAGVLLHTLATGAPPFDGADVAWDHVHTAPPPLPPDTPRALVMLVDRLLRKDPGERPASARATLDALRAASPADRQPPLAAGLLATGQQPARPATAPLVTDDSPARAGTGPLDADPQPARTGTGPLATDPQPARAGTGPLDADPPRPATGPLTPSDPLPSPPADLFAGRPRITSRRPRPLTAPPAQRGPVTRRPGLALRALDFADGLAGPLPDLPPDTGPSPIEPTPPAPDADALYPGPPDTAPIPLDQIPAALDLDGATTPDRPADEPATDPIAPIDAPPAEPADPDPADPDPADPDPAPAPTPAPEDRLPDDPIAAARHLLACGRADAALRRCVDVEGARRTDPAVRIELRVLAGRALLARGDTDRAFEAFDLALHADPGPAPDLLAEIADAAVEADHVGVAIDAALRALIADLDRGRALLARVIGRVLLRRADPPVAHQMLPLAVGCAHLALRAIETGDDPGPWWQRGREVGQAGMMALTAPPAPAFPLHLALCAWGTGDPRAADHAIRLARQHGLRIPATIDHPGPTVCLKLALLTTHQRDRARHLPPALAAWAADHEPA